MVDAENTAIIMLLTEILNTLKEMKQQEKEYWDTWKQAKELEHKK